MRFFVIAILVLMTATAAAEALGADGAAPLNPSEAFNKAYLLYNSSKFKEAAEEYEKILTSGYESGNIYYNLGNAYFKAGLLGKAILNYKRAERLIPNDNDLRSNLEYALSLTEKPVMDRHRMRLSQHIDSFLDSFTMDGLAVFSSCAYSVTMALLTLGIFFKNIKRPILYMVLMLSLAVLSGLTLLSIKAYRLGHMQKGIVVLKEQDCRFEPREDAVVHFKLYEGSLVYKLKAREGFSQIKREDGKVGWIESSSYELI